MTFPQFEKEKLETYEDEVKFNACIYGHIANKGIKTYLCLMIREAYELGIKSVELEGKGAEHIAKMMPNAKIILQDDLEILKAKLLNERK